MAQASEGTTEVVEAVKFGFMTNEEVRKHSVVRITNPVLVDAMGTPCPNGLYDPSLGPLNENSLCVTCGQRSYLCNGHCGHILLVSPAFNPLLFNLLYKVLNKTCLYCFHFQSSKAEVERCVIQLELIAKGDIVGAKRLSSATAMKESDNILNDIVDRDDSHGSYSSHSTVLSGVPDNHESGKGGRWDSIHLTEAMSVLDEFLKTKEAKKKCKNCKCKSPSINKPTYGWLDLAQLDQPTIRANAIQSSKLDAAFSGSEEVNATDSSWKDGSETAEADSFILSSDVPENCSRRHIKNKKNFTHDLEELMASSGPLLPSQVMYIMSRLWKNEAPLCSYMCNILPEKYDNSGNILGYSMFFLETILVTPIKFRPPAKSGDSIMEHPLTVLLGKVLTSNIALGEAHNSNAEQSKIIRRWMELQQSINVYIDSKTSSIRAQRDSTGIIQLLEKKEGAFRQKMMGKRVNFACRSVISPDPYLGVHEIGVPPYFALRLTYPERVTPWNVEKLRDAVINGPDVLPGAITYADSSGTSKLPRDADRGGRGQMFRMAISRKLPSSRGAVTALGKTNEPDLEGKVVYRHLQDGDIVLVNRQPTLHKPSIMAHVVRILKGEKTLRMHYANCSSYNADFDGDEMNVHFPQDEISRAEAYNIVNANEQYIVPTRGDTVRGLIQDHIVSAVLLTMKNTFLTRSEFNQLLYGSGVFAATPSSFSGKPGQTVSLLDSESPVAPVLPAVWKPKPLWTGKQVITALLNHITRGLAPCTVENQGKIPKNYFTNDSYKNGEEELDQNAEHKILIWKNELVRGVIDKAQFGKFGLVHTVQELYGSNSAGVLLSALSRLFTLFLQIHGFTCGVDDLMILPDYDAQRKEKLEGEDIGEEVHCEFVNFKPGQIGPEELQMEIEKAISSDRESATAMLDMKMKNKLTNKLTREGSQILKHLLTAGLLKPFPRNCISAMTTSGAKGSTVNFQQISAYLGQQELEGKRVPRMVSGKSLPSFPPWDYTSRAGGFITDRFLTGLRPQEYYFHCMAGREGLVDTAVKTSRSGYLQRCLVKNLESLRVWYDSTVRDADGSVIQFHYGEDGVDAHKTSFLKNFKSLKDNQETFCQKFQHKREFNTYINKLPEGLEEQARRFIQGARDKSLEFEKAGGSEHPHKKRKTRKKECLSEKQEESGIGGENLMEVVKQKYLYSLAESGEPVGVIAAQSVGEPSTQMTLNTFHLAGRGEMNVTLGIPRLQEILMTASDVIKTPILTCPFLQWRSRHDVVSLVSKAKKVAISDLVESMEVELSVRQKRDSVDKIYKLKINLKDTEFVSLRDTRNTLQSVYLRELEEAIESHVKFLERVSGIRDYSVTVSGDSNDIDEDMPDITTRDRDDEDDIDVGDDMEDDLGADVAKRKQQATDEVDYDEPDIDVNEDELSARTGEDTETEENGEEAGPSDSDEVSKSKDEDNEDEVVPDAKFEWFSNRPPRHILKIHKGLCFEVHFRFTNEPHLLLAQIAQRTAKKVYIKNAGKISNCRMVPYDPDEKTVIWEDTKRPKKGNTEKSGEDTAYWAVKASGVDFQSLWELQEDLDMSRLYSNNVHAMLVTYGVEAARATIIREVTQVFDIYGVKVDFHHLSLIADFMTHTGGYRAMSRHGGIADSPSPFLKMSFETASKYIVEAASYGLTDHLESPSSRICLGLPVKMGTGSFELMQKLDV